MRMRSSNIYTVAQVNGYIKGMFVQDFLLSGLCVQGEASNVKYHSSGHIYFTLKDESGSLAAVMFAGSRKGLSFPLRDGQRILVTGQINVYERDGRYQLYAKEIRPDGLGELYQRFEQLKTELEERGMFAAQYKQPIPTFVHRLGVVTAPTGAAIRDIITVARRRNPYIEILLYPALVQGEGAAHSVACGIRELSRRGVDCIIAGRGGGSLEDLWAFNEEEVAQAIFDCETPLISAVGHETDTTIADYVADLRAPTPSAAAELAVYDYYDFMDSLREKQAFLNRRMQDRLSDERDRVKRLELSLRLYRPEYRIANLRQTLSDNQERLRAAMERRLERERHQLNLAAARLDSLSPLKRLGGGYGFVADSSGAAVESVQSVQTGQMLRITLADGRLFAQVTGSEGLKEPEEGSR